MVLSTYSNSIFIKYIKETFVPVSVTDTYSRMEVQGVRARSIQK
jgi:hypothetical protein